MDDARPPPLSRLVVTLDGKEGGGELRNVAPHTKAKAKSACLALSPPTDHSRFVLDRVYAVPLLACSVR